MWTRGVHENFTINSTLGCGADAYPAAQYKWQTVRGSGLADGQYFVVDSPGFFNVSCTPYNFLRPPHDQCVGDTVYLSGFSPLFYCSCTAVFHYVTTQFKRKIWPVTIISVAQKYKVGQNMRPLCFTACKFINSCLLCT